MKSFKTFEGVVMPINSINIDTDAIIPKQFLKRIERSGFGQFVFYELRFDENDKPIENSVFNNPLYKGAEILIAGANFGCGSSREHAPWALEDYGFKVIIAPSFADIFYNNCFNNGILPIKLSQDIMDDLFKKATGNTYKLTVSLEEQTIRDSEGLQINFEIDAFHKNKLIKGLDDIGLTLLKEEKIYLYEREHNIV